MDTSTIVAIGVDIGTGSVRVYHNETLTSLPITTENDIYITQSSFEIYSKLIQLLSRPQLDWNFDSICITATCSMVVLSKITIDEETYLTPVSLNKSHPNSDVLLWMDNSATLQCNQLNEYLKVAYQNILNLVGGQFVPELGLPKLKMINDNFAEGDNNDNFSKSDLVCFELYDWISYLLKVGGFQNINASTNGNGDDKLIVPYIPSKPFDFGDAIDGSIKGWPHQFLQDLGITVEIGRSESNIGNRLLPIGTPIGKVNDTDIIIGHGCIDCYSGFMNMYRLSPSEKSSTLSTMSMIAGTSTCFIYSTMTPTRTTDENSAPPDYIPTVWGPVEIGKSGLYLYEFGQPATGKLFEDFLTIGFDQLEQETQNLELKHNKSIHELIKGYFYYGDVYGNRNPYGDPKMSQMIIDNNNDILPSVISPNNQNKKSGNVLSQVIKYILILEFLVFQTKQLLEPLSNVSQIIINGSQSKNTRFLKLLSTVTGLPIIIANHDVARGAQLMALIGKLCSFGWHYDDAFDQAIQNNNNDYLGNENSINIREDYYQLLMTKYEIFKDMASAQQRYRKLMGDV